MNFFVHDDVVDLYVTKLLSLTVNGNVAELKYSAAEIVLCSLCEC